MFGIGRKKVLASLLISGLLMTGSSVVLGEELSSGKELLDEVKQWRQEMAEMKAKMEPMESKQATPRVVPAPVNGTMARFASRADSWFASYAESENGAPNVSAANAQGFALSGQVAPGQGGSQCGDPGAVCASSEQPSRSCQ